MLSLDASSGGEVPTTSTAVLVLHGGDVSFARPVNSGWQVPVGGEISHVSDLAWFDSAQVGGLELLETKVGWSLESLQTQIVSDVVFLHLLSNEGLICEKLMKVLSLESVKVLNKLKKEKWIQESTFLQVNVVDCIMQVQHESQQLLWSSIATLVWQFWSTQEAASKQTPKSYGHDPSSIIILLFIYNMEAKSSSQMSAFFYPMFANCVHAKRCLPKCSRFWTWCYFRNCSKFAVEDDWKNEISQKCKIHFFLEK